jgi:hypothetical protein
MDEQGNQSTARTAEYDGWASSVGYQPDCGLLAVEIQASTAASGPLNRLN